MFQIKVQLPPDRNFTGLIHCEDDLGNIVAGPFKVSGRASDRLAAEHGNASRTTTLPYGDTPLGSYKVIQILPTGDDTVYNPARYGRHGLIVLEPKDGDAALAEANGRFIFFIQGGALDNQNRLKPTSGSLRVADKDQKELVQALQRTDPKKVICLCLGANSWEYGSTVAPEIDFDELDPPRTPQLNVFFPTSPVIIRYPAAQVIAHGEYDSEPGGTHIEMVDGKPIEVPDGSHAEIKDGQVTIVPDHPTPPEPSTPLTPGGIDAQTGALISQMSRHVAQDYTLRGVQYVFGGDASAGGTTSDCSHFVRDIFAHAGVNIPFTSTGRVAQSPHFIEVPAASARPGDIIVQSIHMGVFTGDHDARGHPIGVQMGNHGAQPAPWGPGRWFKQDGDIRFYRPRP